MQYRAEIFGSILKELRIEKGMTAEQLAQKIGKTDRTVHRLEAGQVNATLPVLIHICNAFDVTSDYFLKTFFLSNTKDDKANSTLEQVMEKIAKMDIHELKFVLNLLKVISDFRR